MKSSRIEKIKKGSYSTLQKVREEFMMYCRRDAAEKIFRKKEDS